MANKLTIASHIILTIEKCAKKGGDRTPPFLCLLVSQVTKSTDLNLKPSNLVLALRRCDATILVNGVRERTICMFTGNRKIRYAGKGYGSGYIG